MDRDNDPRYLVRAAKIVFISGCILLGAGLYVLLPYGENPPLTEPVPFLALLGVVLGVISMFATVAIFGKAARINDELQQSGKGVLMSRDTRTIKIFFSIFIVIVMLWYLCPFVLRPLYGVPLYGPSPANVVEHENDPNFVGCYLLQGSSRSVICKNTGIDGILEFLMHEPRR